MSIDSSLRDATILPGSDGTVIPDEQPLLASNPQLVMEPGVVRPSWKFEDGQGLTDEFGNVYVGYGNAGGASSINVNDSGEQVIDDNISGVEEGDFLQWNNSQQLYVPRNREEANLSQNIVSDYIAIHIDYPENKDYKIINGTPFEQRISSMTWEFETGGGSVSLSQGGTLSPAGDQFIQVSGLTGSPPRGLIVMIYFEYDQNEAEVVL